VRARVFSFILAGAVGFLSSAARAASSSTAAEVGASMYSTDVSRQNALRSADWVRDAVIYSVYLRSYSPSGKIFAVTDRLPELKNLGVTCVWLLPIHPIGDVKRKGRFGSPYSVKDYAAVNLEYGTKDMLKAFVEEAHLLGIKVIIDWVANHTAWDHPWIKAHPEWYRRDARGEIVSPNADWTDVAQLDYSNPELRKAMIAAMRTWIDDVKIDGFRCDVADLIPDDFWAEARRELLKAKPGLLMLAEGERPSHHLASFDLTYASDLYRTFAAVARGEKKARDIQSELDRAERAFPQGALRMLFTENHDTVRSAELFGPCDRAFDVLIFSLPGVPHLYNGQEIRETRTPSLFEKEVIDWKEGTRRNADQKKFFRTLSKLRTSHLSMSRGQRFPVDAGNGEQVLSYALSYRGDAVWVAVNCSSQPYRGGIEIPEVFLDDKGRFAGQPVFDGDFLKTSKEEAAQLSLPAWGYQVWETP
jgi:glycosidase